MSWLSVAEHKKRLWLAGYGTPNIFKFDPVESVYTDTMIELVQTGSSNTDYASICFHGDLMYAFKGKLIYTIDPNELQVIDEVETEYDEDKRCYFPAVVYQSKAWIITRNYTVYSYDLE
jgi:hypothetical protein